MEVAETCKEIVRRECPSAIVNVTSKLLRNVRGMENGWYWVPVVENLTLVPSNQVCTVGNEIMDKNTKQSEAVKVRKAENKKRWRNKNNLMRI